MSSALASSLQAIVATSVVIALILGLAWLARRFAGGVVQGGLLRVRSAAAVGARERVVVVEIGEEWLVLGVAAGRVDLLVRMPRGEAPEPQSPASFSSWLARARAAREPSR